MNFKQALNMKYKDFEYYLSPERMSRYYNACGYDKVKAKKLYRINLKLSKSFLPLLSLFEVGLRNAIHRELSLHFADPDWIIHQQSGFMISPSLGSKMVNNRVIAERYLLNEVKKAQDKFRRSSTNLTSARLIAEQNFGFWTAMFDKKYFHTLSRIPLKAFNALPPGINETVIFPKLRLIRNFRNRISHHEPICFNQNGIYSSTQAQQTKQLIYELSAWIGTDFKSYI
ncbi:MAG: Abi family protein, partial [Bacteroidia bacterium]